MTAIFRGALAALALLLFQAQKPTATIEGIVLRAGTSQPVSDARVEAMPQFASSLGLISTTSNAEGRFVLRGLDPGTYQLEVAADGFARQQYGTSGPTGLEGTSSGRALGTAITVTAGQRLQGLVFKLTPTGSISGRIRELDGRPAAEIWVQLLRPAYSYKGKKTFVVVGKAHTDDHGDYRLYWITPGRYYLGIVSSLDYELDVAALGREPRSGLRFFPGVSEIERADAINVGAGAELKGMDMTMPSPKFYSIRGRIIDEVSGSPPEAAIPSLSFVGFTGSVSLGSTRNYDPADGSFEFADLSPGNYVVGAFESSFGHFSQVRVAVTNTDVKGLVLTMRPPVSIPIKVDVDQGALSSIAGSVGWRFSLETVIDEVNLGYVGQSSALKADGTSTLENIPPGLYRLPLSAPSSDVYLKEIQYAGKDVLGKTFLVSTDQPGGLTILLGLSPGEINGEIANADNQPSAGIRAVLIPGDRNQTDLYRTVRADSAGHFVLRGLSPGDYKLFAWENIEPNSWFDAAVIQGYEMLGKPVHVVEGSKQNVNLLAIP